MVSMEWPATFGCGFSPIIAILHRYPCRRDRFRRRLRPHDRGPARHYPAQRPRRQRLEIADVILAELAYQSGFGNEFATEALPGALPVGRNSPQRCAYGLYAEQISGTAFTAPRGDNRRTWLYRIRPAASTGPSRASTTAASASDFGAEPATAEPAALEPVADPGCVRRQVDFVDGLVTMAGNGDPHAQTGCGIHLYAANRSMTDRYFYDADGELLIVPQQGRLRLVTELGRDRSGAAGDRGDPARASASGSNCPTAWRAATSARTSARRSGCRTSGRSAPTDSPIRATS